MRARIQRFKFLIGNSVGVHWRLNKWIYIWLAIFVIAGVAIGLSMIFNPRMTANTISNNLLDGNILRVIRANTGVGAILAGRIFSFSLIFAFIFAMCLSKWTVLGVFPLAAYQGFSLVINLYWAILRFGVFSGTVLFVVYLVLKIILLVITLVAIVYCLRCCSEIRRGGFRGGMRWRHFFHGCFGFLCAIVVFALVEWFMYWLVLSKILFIAVGI